MKTIIFSIILCLSATILLAQTDSQISSEGTTITVTISAPNQEGTIIAGLHNEVQFMKKNLQHEECTIENGKATITFHNVTPGNYAVIILHDKNGNKQMDYDMSGMPMEAYGVSNNAMSFGPPQWGDAKFEVGSEPVEMEIRM